LEKKKLLAESFSAFCSTFAPLQKASRDFREEKTFGGKFLQVLENFSAFAEKIRGKFSCFPPIAPLSQKIF
jgi:hypothetical protein